MDTRRLYHTRGKESRGVGDEQSCTNLIQGHFMYLQTLDSLAVSSVPQ